MSLSYKDTAQKIRTETTEFQYDEIDEKGTAMIILRMRSHCPLRRFFLMLYFMTIYILTNPLPWILFYSVVQLHFIIGTFSLRKKRYNETMNILEKTIDWIRKKIKILTLSSQIRRLNRPLRKIYQELGQDYVSIHRNDEADLNYDKIQLALELENQIKEKQGVIDEMRGIIRCVACGERIPNDSTFCPYCGMRQPEPQVKIVRYCMECGTKLEVDELFCHHCGARVPQEDAVTEEISLHVPVTEVTNEVKE